MSGDRGKVIKKKMDLLSKNIANIFDIEEESNHEHKIVE
jgi:hypothetical protein